MATDRPWLKRWCAAVLVLWPVLPLCTGPTRMVVVLTVLVYLAICLLMRSLSIGIGTCLGLGVGQMLAAALFNHRLRSDESRVIAEYLLPLAGGICGTAFGFLCRELRSRHLTNCFALLSVVVFLISTSGFGFENPWGALQILATIIAGCIVWQRIVAAKSRRPQPVETARHAP